MHPAKLFLINNHKTRRLAAVLLSASACLAGCAPLVPVSTATLAPPASRPQGAATELRLSRQVDIALSTGYRRTLAANSRWRHAGVLPQGDVYRPIDGVFSIEGRQVHEAYLVVSPVGALVGFFLPGESGYSPLSPPIPLPTGDSR